MTKDVRSRRLVRAAVEDRPSNYKEEVEGETKRGDTDDNRSDGGADIPEVPGNRTAEKKQRSLQH